MTCSVFEPSLFWVTASWLAFLSAAQAPFRSFWTCLATCFWTSAALGTFAPAATTLSVPLIPAWIRQTKKYVPGAAETWTSTGPGGPSGLTFTTELPSKEQAGSGVGPQVGSSAGMLKSECVVPLRFERAVVGVVHRDAVRAPVLPGVAAEREGR